MPTKNIVPRATSEGSIGTTNKKWLEGYFNTIYADLIYGGGGGSGNNSAISRTINQTAHGFTIGNVLYYTGTTWAKAKADLQTTFGYFIVSKVNSANSFDITQAGYITGLSTLQPAQYITFLQQQQGL